MSLHFNAYTILFIKFFGRSLCVYNIDRARDPREVYSTSPTHHYPSKQCSEGTMANELAVRTDRGEYVGGDTVYG